MRDALWPACVLIHASNSLLDRCANDNDDELVVLSDSPEVARRSEDRESTIHDEAAE